MGCDDVDYISSKYLYIPMFRFYFSGDKPQVIVQSGI
jgi:hypothetical protein